MLIAPNIKIIVFILFIIFILLSDIYSQELQRLPSLSTEASIGSSYARIKDGTNMSDLYMQNVRASFFLAQIKKISPHFYLSLLTFETSRTDNECGLYFYSAAYNNTNGNNCLINLKRQINFSTGGTSIKYLFPMEDFYFFSSLYLGIGNYSTDGYLLNIRNQKIYTASFSFGIHYPIHVGNDESSIWFLIAELFTTQRSVTAGAILNNSGLDVSEAGLRLGFNNSIIFKKLKD